MSNFYTPYDGKVICDNCVQRKDPRNKILYGVKMKECKIIEAINRNIEQYINPSVWDKAIIYNFIVDNMKDFRKHCRKYNINPKVILDSLIK